VLRESNRRRLRETGRVVWLTAEVDEMWRRMQDDSTTSERRPNLSHGGRAEIEQLAESRRPLYAECADLSIPTDGRSPGDVAKAILDSCSTSS